MDNPVCNPTAASTRPGLMKQPARPALELLRFDASHLTCEKSSC
jgi:hypothetical protein